MARESNSLTLAEWRRLNQGVITNNGEVSHLEARRVRLEELLARAQAIQDEQVALTASKQDASKRLQAVIKDGSKVASFLKAGLREQYRGSEKLVEYGLRPFRSRRKAKPEEPPVELKADDASQSPQTPQ